MLHLSDSALSFPAEFVSETNILGGFLFCIFVGTKKTLNMHIILNLSDSGSDV